MLHASPPQPTPRRMGFLLDLALYVAVMFAVRQVWFDELDFMANGLFWSLTTLLVASWRMRARGVSWGDLGLHRPARPGRVLLIAAGIVAATVFSIIVFEVIKDQLALDIAKDTSEATAGSRFGDLQGNWSLFAVVMGFVLVQSSLEEMLDRGFLITWVERALGGSTLATVAAVALPAALVGARHFPSHGVSGSMTVVIISVIMGVAYVAFGRNLWPLILAHITLNTISMVNRVL